MADAINVSFIGGLWLGDLASHFQRLQAGGLDEVEMSARLLNAIRTSTLLATYTMPIWLSFVKDPSAIVEPLRQQFSVRTRRCAIKALGRFLRRPDWKTAWDSVGAIPGLLSLFAELSVSDVRYLSDTIGYCAKGRMYPGRDQQITELFCGLVTSHFPYAVHQSSDQRPLFHHYVRLLPACSSDFIEDLLLHKTHFFRPSPSKLCLQRHSVPFAKLARDILFEKRSSEINLQQILPCIYWERGDSFPFQPGWYVSMLFALELLRRLAAHEEVDIQQFSLSNLVKSLIERAIKKKSSWDLLHEIIGLSISVLAARPVDSDEVFSRDGSFLRSVVHCWSAEPELFEDQLKELLSLAQHRRLDRDDKHMDLIFKVDHRLRYSLLRLLLLHANDPPRDIDDPKDLKNMHLVWPLYVFTSLPLDHALSLLERLLRVRTELDFLGLGGGILALPSYPGSRHVDPQLLQLYLTRGRDASAEAAKLGEEAHQIPYSKLMCFEAVIRHKKKAATAREQTNRAFFAKSALFYAIASGSLKLVGDVVLWMRRYTRDPLTVKSLYSANVIGCREGIELLSGLPEKPSPGVSTEELSLQVEQANDILRALFEIACQALREPSYYEPDWRGPLDMFNQVVAARLNHIAALDRDLHVSDNDIYQIIWSSTIDMLIHVERTALESDHAALNFNYLSGPLSWISLKRDLPSSLRFIDDLARARSQLWQSYRPSVFPAVTTLSPPWPRGLPIQFLLTPSRITLESTDNLTPFISSRAKEVVFLDSDVALCAITDSDEVQEAIGPFVDEYATALKTYVLQVSSATDRQERLSLAWKHALKDLTGDRMTANEAIRFWRSQFAKALPGLSLPDNMDGEEEKMWPTLPEVDELQQTEEWNPMVDQPSRIKSRELSPVPTCIDCMLAAPSSPVLTITTAFRASHQKTIELSPPSGIWDLARFRNPRKLPRPIRDGLVISALLYLDSKKGGTRRILASPFPSGEAAAHYPPLFLDEEFLLRTDLSELDALKVLGFYLDSVPPTLLLDLATACVDELSLANHKASKTILLEHMAFSLVLLLAKCDQPTLAAKFVQNFILNYPNASSWHRQFLQPSFLRRLSPHDTYTFLVSLVESIQSILDEQKLKWEASYTQEEQAGSSTIGNPSQPFIKVTTAKYLAQILDGADFITVDTTVDILSRMFESATHIDVRVEVLRRMSDILSRYSDDEFRTLLVDRLIKVMEFTIPLMGGPDERKRMTDEDWAVAERSNTPPDVGDESPILDILLDDVMSTRTSAKVRQQMMRRVIWPIITQSIETNAKWYKIFAQKHSLGSVEIPHMSYPIRTKLPLKILAKCPEWVPLWLLQLYHRFLITNLRPSPEIRRINEKVLTEPTLRSSNEGQHWLSQYNQGSSAIGASVIVNFLIREWSPSLLEDSSNEDAVQARHVQDIVKDISYELLMIHDQDLYRWIKFTNQLAPPLRTYSQSQDQQAWLTNGRPVVEHLIKLVQNTRSSKAWQDNPDRRPSILPSTFGMTLWLLPYPCLQPSNVTTPARCALFAGELAKQIEQLTITKKPFHREVQELIIAATRPSLEDRFRVGCEIGTLGVEERVMAMADYLRLEMAERLLKDAQQVRDKDLQGTVRKLVQAWRSSRDEEIRRIGLRMVVEGI